MKCKGEEECDAIAKCHNAGHFDDLAHSVGGKNAEVKEEKTDFCERDAGDVEELLDVEKLSQLVRLWAFGDVGKFYIENSSNSVEFESPHILS